MLRIAQFHRKDLILNLINHFGPVSRTELITMTDLRPATVGDIIKELLDEKQIIQTGAVSGGHGRRRVMLEINREYLCAIGIAFTPGEVVCIISRTDGSIAEQAIIPAPSGISRLELCGRITLQVKGLLASNAERRIVGIGICNPLNDPTTYEARDSLQSNYRHFNDWILQDLVPSLERTCGIPVEAYSAVTLPAMAEQRFGAARGKQNFICVELSNGIGSSICSNGVMISGANGSAGELGHTLLSVPGAQARICYCGKPGCVEASASWPVLAGKIRDALRSGVFSVLSTYHDNAEDFTVADIRRAIEEGDRMCRQYVKESARQLGIAIANAVTLLNPELIVLFGFMVELGDYFLAQLEDSIRSNTLVLSDSFEIKISQDQGITYPLGAAAEVFASYLKTDQYQWVYRAQKEDDASASPAP